MTYPLRAVMAVTGVGAFEGQWYFLHLDCNHYVQIPKLPEKQPETAPCPRCAKQEDDE